MSTSLFNRVGDLVNPISVKEMRQAVKGRILTWILILFLLVQLLIIGIGTIVNEFRIQKEFAIGSYLSFILLFALLVVCLLFLPAIFGLRLSSERAGTRIDLLFITGMNPYSIIWGKTLAAVGLTLLLFSTSIPFLTLTYLLRGIDIPSLFIVIMFNFIVVIMVIQGAILLGALPGGIILRSIRFLFGLGGSVFVLSIMSSISMEMLGEGLGSMLGSWDFWGPALTILGFMLFIMGFLYVLSATVISPPSSNRAPAIRLYILAFWCFCLFCATVWYKTTLSDEIFASWFVFMLILLCLTFLLSLTERYTYGARIRMKIPDNVLMRVPLFFLYSGTAGGILFYSGLILLTYLVLCACRILSVDIYDKTYWRTTTTLLYVICYGLTGFWVRRVFFPERLSNTITLMISFIIMAFGSFVPFLLAWFLIYRNLGMVPDYWYIGNPFIILFEERMLVPSLTLTTVWGVIAFAVNVPWLISQIRGFKPMPPEIADEIISGETVLKPVVVEDGLNFEENADTDETNK